MNEPTLTLQLREGTDMVEIRHPNGTPAALVHIDTFWQGYYGTNDVYEAIVKGDPVEVELVLEEE